jgi:hypothetical protein
MNIVLLLVIVVLAALIFLRPTPPAKARLYRMQRARDRRAVVAFFRGVAAMPLSRFVAALASMPLASAALLGLFLAGVRATEASMAAVFGTHQGAALAPTHSIMSDLIGLPAAFVNAVQHDFVWVVGCFAALQIVLMLGIRLFSSGSGMSSPTQCNT